MERKIHKKIIPIPDGERTFAYQEEPTRTVLVLRGHPPFRRGKEPYLNDEQDKISGYELRIENHTQNCLLVTLSKIRSDIREQRIENGEAIIRENFQFGISFAELVNKIFAGENVLEYQTTESLPDAIKTKMKTVYDDIEQSFAARKKQ